MNEEFPEGAVRNASLYFELTNKYEQLHDLWDREEYAKKKDGEVFNALVESP